VTFITIHRCIIKTGRIHLWVWGKVARSREWCQLRLSLCFKRPKQGSR